METLVNYISKYGIAVFVIACSIIALIGFLKICKVFDKIKSAEVRKAIYYVLNIILAFGVSAIYFAIFKIPFNTNYVVFSASQIGATTALYTIYENIGIRKFVRYVMKLVSQWIKKNPDNELSKWANKVGLEDALKQIQDEIAERDAKVIDETNTQAK